MHFLDVVILVCMLSLGTLGYFTGLVGQLSTPLAILAGIVCAWYGQPWLVEQMQDWFEQPLTTPAVAVVGAFLAGVLVVKVVAAIIRAKVGEGESKTADHCLGAAFGLVKGTLLAGVIVLLIGNYGKAELMQDSVGGPALYAGAEWAIDTVQARGLLDKAKDWTTAKKNFTAGELSSMMQQLNQERQPADAPAKEVAKKSGKNPAAAR